MRSPQGEHNPASSGQGCRRRRRINPPRSDEIPVRGRRKGRITVQGLLKWRRPCTPPKRKSLIISYLQNESAQGLSHFCRP